MTLELTLPFGKKDNVKNIVFSILTKEYPLKIIELTNYIRKRYGKSVTFQAVRKAILQLVDEEVLKRENNEFSINKEWVLKSKRTLDSLYEELTKEKATPDNINSIEGEVSVFTFNTMNEMITFWQDIIEDWYKHFKKGDPNINAHQATHLWEGLLHMNNERKVMGQLKKKGIKSYSLLSGNTTLDRNMIKFYKEIGIKAGPIHTNSKFDKSHYIATYGEIVVQTKLPPNMVKALDNFFQKNKTLEDFNLKELSDIANKKVKVKLTVIKNLAIAEQINKSIISQIE